MKQLHDWFGNCSAPRAGWQIDPFVSILYGLLLSDFAEENKGFVS